MSVFMDLLKNLRRRPVTKLYPLIKESPPPRLRGQLVFDMVKCIGCSICERDCPSGTIKMIGKGKEAEFELYMYRCTFCSQCADSCPVDAITLTQDFELAGFTKESLTRRFKRPK